MMPAGCQRVALLFALVALSATSLGHAATPPTGDVFASGPNPGSTTSGDTYDASPCQDPQIAELEQRRNVRAYRDTDGQVGIAAHAYHDVNLQFPGWQSGGSKDLWLPKFLPFIRNAKRPERLRGSVTSNLFRPFTPLKTCSSTVFPRISIICKKQP